MLALKWETKKDTQGAIADFSVADGRIIKKPVGYVRSLALEGAKVQNLQVSIEENLSERLLGQNYLRRYDVRILQTEVELYLR